LSEEYRTIIYAGKEDQNREYKRSFPWNRKTDGRTMAKVAKTILAMSNLRDGGHIVIGIQENDDKTYTATGVQDAHITTFSYDDVADFVRKYAEPYAKFALEVVTLDEHKFVVISVSGFDEIPVICKDSYADILKVGTVYIRPSSGRPQSAPISNYVDMRDLLDLSVDRGIRRFLERQSRVGQLGIESEEKFAEQVGQFADTVPLEKIKSRGYWEVIIRPSRFVTERIKTLPECERLVEKNQIRLRGWYFPHFDKREVRRGLDYIETHISFNGITEAWRLYQSSQLVFYSVIREDWAEEMTWLTPQQRADLPPEGKLEALSALRRLSEIYEFATRLTQEGVLGEQVVISINIVGTHGRELFIDSFERALWPGQYICETTELPREVTVSAEDLIANSREYSFQHYRWLIERFNFDGSPEVFRHDQDKFFEGRH
jgi:hypothetical protein